MSKMKGIEPVDSMTTRFAFDIYQKIVKDWGPNSKVCKLWAKNIKKYGNTQNPDAQISPAGVKSFNNIIGELEGYIDLSLENKKPIKLTSILKGLNK